MRILFLDQFPELGGAQRSLLELLPSVRQAGWEAHLAAPGDGPLAARAREQGALVHALPLSRYSAGRKRPGDAARLLRDLPPLIARLRELDRLLNPDVVYVNGPRLLPAVWRARLGRPVIFHAHSYVPVSNGRPLVTAALKATGATIIAATRFTARQWRGARVVYGGVEGPPAGWTRAAKKPGLRIGLIGRFERGKCQKEFALAAAELAPDWPEAKFLLAGDARDDDPAASDYKQAVLASAPASLQYLGWRDDVYEVLSTLDLLVMPSLREGGVPFVVLDAFAAGVPVLASPAGDLEEIIRDGENGFLLPSTSPREIAARLSELLAQPERLAAAAERARRLWRERFTAERFRREIREIILDVVRKS